MALTGHEGRDAPVQSMARVWTAAYGFYGIGQSVPVARTGVRREAARTASAVVGFDHLYIIFIIVPAESIGQNRQTRAVLRASGPEPWD